jgi:ketosteroid isomerase-like protein
MPTAPTLTIDNWEAANHDLDGRFVAAMSTKDIERAMSCFLDSPDLLAVLWGKELRGPDQLREAISNLFAAYDEIALSIDRVQEFRSGDSVFAVGQATYTLIKAGKASRLTEIWTDVRHEVNGRWVYVMDHAEALPN